MMKKSLTNGYRSACKEHPHMPKRDDGRGVTLPFVFLYHREYENLLQKRYAEAGRDGMMYVPGPLAAH